MIKKRKAVQTRKIVFDKLSDHRLMDAEDTSIDSSCTLPSKVGNKRDDDVEIIWNSGEIE